MCSPLTAIQSNLQSFLTCCSQLSTGNTRRGLFTSSDARSHVQAIYRPKDGHWQLLVRCTVCRWLPSWPVAERLRYWWWYKGGNYHQTVASRGGKRWARFRRSDRSIRFPRFDACWEYSRRRFSCPDPQRASNQQLGCLVEIEEAAAVMRGTVSAIRQRGDRMVGFMAEASHPHGSRNTVVEYYIHVLWWYNPGVEYPASCVVLDAIVRL